MIFNQVGTGLDEPVAKCQWCKEAGIRSGAVYLLHWAASMLRRPASHLPYLFFFSKEQNTGKSSFAEALALLMENGHVEADKALKNSNDFNGELHGKVLCIVEETDLQESTGVYNKVKNWVTADKIGIQFKGKDVVMLPNYTHWVQTSNSRESVPIASGDQRIVAIEVAPLLPNEEIPKEKMKEHLISEAPSFLRTLWDVEFAEPYGRLYLPVLETEEKVEAMKTASPLTHKQEALREEIPRLLNRDEQFEGTSSELAEALGVKYTPSSVGKLIRQIVKPLSEDGIIVELTERDSKTRPRMRIYRKATSPIGEDCLHTSA